MSDFAKFEVGKVYQRVHVDYTSIDQRVCYVIIESIDEANKRITFRLADDTWVSKIPVTKWYNQTMHSQFIDFNPRERIFASDLVDFKPEVSTEENN